MMAPLGQTKTLVLATAFGLVMVGLAAVGSHGPALVAAMLAVVAVGVGMAIRQAATLAVLLSVCTLVASGPSVVFAAWSGLCAAAYLVCRHAAGTAAGAIGSWPTIVAAVSFTFAGVAATAFPLQVPWLPVVAPLAVLGIYVLATRPFLG
jgi:hypothetical protein